MKSLYQFVSRKQLPDEWEVRWATFNGYGDRKPQLEILPTKEEAIAFAQHLMRCMCEVRGSFYSSPEVGPRWVQPKVEETSNS